MAVLRRCYALGNREVLVRLIVAIIAAALLSVGMQLWFAALWVLTYVLFLAVIAVLVGRAPLRVARSRLWPIAAAEAVTVILWLALIQYLLAQPHPSTEAIALLILGAVMTISIGERAGDLLLRASDRVLLTLGFLLVVRHHLWRAQGALEAWVFVAVCLMLLIWAQVLLVQTGLRQQEQRERDARALDQQRVEAIGRLTGGVAHDFNNILTVIGGNLDLMREVTDPSEKLALLAEARTATARAGAVTAQLLAYSRQAVLAPVDLDVAVSLGRVQGFLARLLPPKVELIMAPDPGLAPIRLDATRFESALINLILNARDAMPGGGRITVTAGLAAGDTALQVTVVDTGNGIDPAILPRVVEPYFTTKGPGRGSGLGLSMAKGFAEQSGGSLTIQSTPGTGTTVRMLFPYGAGAARTSATSAAI
jgi:signal transduction histidine kinase